mgnify:CR=1 FL=1
MKFTKGHGTQNDFVVLPDLDCALELTAGAVAALCDRRRGLGADGVLRVTRAGAAVDAGALARLPEGVDAADWFMDYRNADGSAAEMCGNGVRVFAHYLAASGLEDRGEFVVGQFFETDVPRFSRLDRSARGFVCDAERNPLAHHPFRNVGGQREAERGELRHPVGVEREGPDQTGHRGQQQLELRDGIEDRLLVLLQVAVVGQRLGLEGSQQAGQVSDQSAGLAAGQLGDVGVLLLRHDRAARGPRVMQLDVAEFRCAPENDVFGEPGKVDGDHGEHEGRLGREITRRRGVDGVVGGSVEAQVRGDRVGVEAQRTAGERARTVGRHRNPLVQVE